VRIGVVLASRAVKFVLGKFACFCLETRFGSDVPIGAQAALRHYTRRLKSQKEPVAVPSFYLGQAPDGAEAELDLAVEPEIEALLENEAQRQAVPVERLLAHAVFVYVADLDVTVGGLP
jgi:hypothetical protein